MTTILKEKSSTAICMKNLCENSISLLFVYRASTFIYSSVLESGNWFALPLNTMTGNIVEFVSQISVVSVYARAASLPSRVHAHVATHPAVWCQLL